MNMIAKGVGRASIIWAMKLVRLAIHRLLNIMTPNEHFR